MTRITSFLIKIIDAVIDRYILKPDLEKLFGSIDKNLNTIEDITPLKLAEHERESTIKILSIANKSTNIQQNDIRSNDIYQETVQMQCCGNQAQRR